MINWLRLQKHKNELNRTKKELVQEIDLNILNSRNSINDISKILIDFKKYKYHKHDSFLNLCIFSDIVTIDLTIILEKIRIAEREEEKKLYVRVLTIIIVDYLDNIGVLIGSECLAELKKNKMIEFMEEFKSIHKKFSDFKKINERELRDIRNNTIAHKSKDALKLNNQINSIEVEKIYNFGLELKIYTTEFVKLSTKVIYYIVDYMTEGRRI